MVAMPCPPPLNSHWIGWEFHCSLTIPLLSLKIPAALFHSPYFYGVSRFFPISRRNLIGQVLLWPAVWATFAFLMAAPEHPWAGLQRSLLLTVGLMVIVLWNTAILLPRFFLKKKYFLYGLLALASVAALVFLMNYLSETVFELDFRGRRKFKFRGSSLRREVLSTFFRSLPYLLALVISTMYRITTLANRREKEAVELQKEKLETEMKFLRSQINPHFLFNALNNIYALSVLEPDRTPDYLLKISGMLRYMLYECNADTVPLSKEVEYLRNYVDIGQLKDSRGLNIELQLQGDDSQLPIAPLLFVPFVENAFKHSRIEDVARGWIRIQLEVSEDKKVHFRVENSLPEAAGAKDPASGIGLRNVQRRLELLYPESHELSIEEHAETFCVSLKLEL